jgi:hypothetical protein
MKSDLFECFLQLPSPGMYAPKFVHLLHSVCEEIVSEDGTRVPGVWKKLLHEEDRVLTSGPEKAYRTIAE